MMAGWKRRGNPYSLLVGIQIRTDITEKDMKMLRKAKNSSAVSNCLLLNLYPGMKSACERGTCTPTLTFITALFTKATTQNQPQCPSADGWSLCTMEYYSVIKR